MWDWLMALDPMTKLLIMVGALVLIGILFGTRRK